MKKPARVLPGKPTPGLAGIPLERAGNPGGDRPTRLDFQRQNLARKVPAVWLALLPAISSRKHHRACG